MKSAILSLMLMLSLSLVNNMFANDDKYKEAMIKNIKAVYEAKDISTYQQAANTFERIAAAEPTKWEALYYASFAYIMMSNIEADKVKKDAYLDQAMTVLDKAKVLVPQESEVIAMEGFVFMMRIPIDPATRGMKFAPQASRAFETAVKLNDNNPRAHALKAQMEFGTAQFFGSSMEGACATNAKAIEKFNAFIPGDELSPVWGKSMTDDLVKNCK